MKLSNHADRDAHRESSMAKRSWAHANADLPEVELTMRACAGATDALLTASDYHLQARGKRWRPLLCLALGDALSVERASIIHVAAAIELLHNASLVHDDLVDRDTRRRSQATVWSAFGDDTALNLGDLYLTGAFHALACMPDRRPETHTVMQLFTHSVRRVINGHARELSMAGTVDVSLTDYTGMARAKSGVLLALPVLAPLALASANSATMQTARDAMEQIGVAYQMMDDLHDVLGLKAGRAPGGDMREGRITLPALVFLSLATEPERARFVRFLRCRPEGSSGEAAQDFSAWAERFQQADVRHGCIIHIRTLLDDIDGHLHRLPDPLRSLLEQGRDQLLPPGLLEEPFSARQPDPVSARETAT